MARKLISEASLIFVTWEQCIFEIILYVFFFTYLTMKFLTFWWPVEPTTRGCKMFDNVLLKWLLSSGHIYTHTYIKYTKKVILYNETILYYWMKYELAIKQRQRTNERTCCTCIWLLPCNRQKQLTTNNKTDRSRCRRCVVNISISKFRVYFSNAPVWNGIESPLSATMATRHYVVVD